MSDVQLMNTTQLVNAKNQHVDQIEQTEMLVAKSQLAMHVRSNRDNQG